MFPPCRRLFIGALLLLLAAAQCQQAEVGEVEAGKGSSSLADFVNNLIDQMNDVKVEMLNMSIVDAYVDTILKYRPALLTLWIVANLIDQMKYAKESREREAKKAGLEVEEAEKVVEEELPFWKVTLYGFNFA